VNDDFWGTPHKVVVHQVRKTLSSAAVRTSGDPIGGVFVLSTQRRPLILGPSIALLILRIMLPSDVDVSG
jgi:hypothetical protein